MAAAALTRPFLSPARINDAGAGQARPRHGGVRMPELPPVNAGLTRRQVKRPSRNAARPGSGPGSESGPPSGSVPDQGSGRIGSGPAPTMAPSEFRGQAASAARASRRGLRVHPGGEEAAQKASPRRCRPLTLDGQVEGKGRVGATRSRTGSAAGARVRAEFHHGPPVPGAATRAPTRVFPAGEHRGLMAVFDQSSSPRCSSRGKARRRPLQSARQAPSTEIVMPALPAWANDTREPRARSPRSAERVARHVQVGPWREQVLCRSSGCSAAFAPVSDIIVVVALVGTMPRRSGGRSPDPLPAPGVTP